MKVVLFDVDGTLLTMGRAARDAFARALSEAAGSDINPDGYSFSGKTDPQIARDILALHGVAGAALEEAIPETIRLYVHYISSDRKWLRDARMMPGVRALLEALAARPDARLGLLTGNVEPGARVKVGHFGLTGYFDFGVSCFGSDDADRYRLPAIAVDRARRSLDPGFTGDRLVLVGDSEHDVLCSREVGARSVAVGTGWTAAAALRALRPDAYLDDLRDTAGAVAAILGNGAPGQRAPGHGVPDPAGPRRPA